MCEDIRRHVGSMSDQRVPTTPPRRPRPAPKRRPRGGRGVVAVEGDGAREGGARRLVAAAHPQLVAMAKVTSRRTVAAEGNGESDSGPDRHQLQVWNQPVREGEALMELRARCLVVVANVVAAQGNGGSGSGPDRHQLQGWNQRVREGRAVAGCTVASDGQAQRVVTRRRLPRPVARGAVAPEY